MLVLKAHLAGADDALVTVKPMRDRFDAVALAALLKPGAQDEASSAAPSPAGTQTGDAGCRSAGATVGAH